MKKLADFRKGTTMTEALKRLGVMGEGRSVASAWSWDSHSYPILSLHFDTPTPWPGVTGSIAHGEMTLPLDAEKGNPRTAIQQSRYEALIGRFRAAADRSGNVAILLVDWLRDGSGRFLDEQLMRPRAAWLVGVQWVDKVNGVVRLRAPSQDGEDPD